MTHTLKLGTIYGTPIFTLQSTSSAVKKVYGASFSGQSKLWRFPAFYPVHSIVLSDLKKGLPDLTLDTAVTKHIEQLARPVQLPADFSFITKPYQHQIDGLLHLYRNLRAGLFYSPGLGKCKITIDLQRLTHETMLVVCPPVMLGTWADEFERHGNIRDVVIIDGTKKQKTKKLAEVLEITPTVTLVSYPIAALYTEELIKINYSVIVADESHQMKTPFSKRTQAVTALSTRAKRRILLSGTPSLGSPFDLYAQLRFLGTYFCPENWWQFRKMFGVFPEYEANENVPKMLLGFKNIDIMNDRVTLISIKKTKEECLDLPDQAIVDIEFSLFNSQKKEYNEFVMSRCAGAGLALREELVAGTLTQQAGVTVPPHVIADETITLLGKVDQIASGFIYMTVRNPGYCNGCVHSASCSAAEIQPYTEKCLLVKSEPEPHVVASKVNARLERCLGLLDSIFVEDTNKVIIWANYHSELNVLENAIKELNVGYVRVQGGLKREELTEAMNTFNQDPLCRVYLGQVSTGVGVTLNAANYMIYYNLPWSLEHYLQSLDRNYRIGQNRKVTVYRLIARYTLDVSKALALDRKMDFAALATAKSVCATCSDYFTRCHKHKIELYDEECKYDRTMLRHTAKIGLIP